MQKSILKDFFDSQLKVFKISNQLLFLRLSPKYNRSLLFGELPDKIWGRLKNLNKKHKASQ